MKIKEINNSGYFISDSGRIFSKNHKSKSGLKEMSPFISNSGYMEIYLHKIKKPFYIHRLVAEAFLPNPDNKEQVNHIDFDKLNNKVENLEWVSQSENCSHFRNAVMNKAGKTSGHSGKLYKDGIFIKWFRSLQQAKKFVKEIYNSNLSTQGTLNENIKTNLVFLRDNENITINQYLLLLTRRKRINMLKNIKHIKKDKGQSGNLFLNGIKVSHFDSIRSVNIYIGHSLQKKGDKLYKVFNYVYILD